MKIRRRNWQVYATMLPDGTKILLPEFKFRSMWDALRFCNAINLPLRGNSGRANVVFNYEQIE